jgi:hypothetical protein
LKRLAALSFGLISIVAVVTAQSVTARLDGEQIRLTAPRLHFLVGDVLNRLHDGATVTYELQLTAKTEKNGRALTRSQERFTISYDLWEEKFAVQKMGSLPKSISHLSAAAAEAWCVENTAVPVPALVPNQQFWIRLDYRVDNAGAKPEQAENSGFTLTGLIDIFSRKTRTEQLRGSEDVGPLRLESLKRK